MRLRPITLALLLVASVSCRSTEPAAPKPADNPEVTEPAPSPTTRTVEASSPNTSQDPMADDTERVQRRRDQRRVLSEESIERGAEALDRADLEAALGHYASALEIDPSSQAARDGLRKVQSLLGDDFATVGLAFEDEVERQTVKRAQALLEVEEHKTLGDQALRAGDYDAAVQRYRQAETILRWHPLIATETLDERIVAGLAEEAERLRDDAVAEAARQQRADAEQAKLVAEDAERRRKENRLVEYYDLANKAYLAERFTEAESWCAQVLLADPGNEAAEHLQRIAREARHNSSAEVNRRNYREQWLRTFEELDTMNVPQTDPLIFGLPRWREVSQRVPLAHAEIDPGADVERESVIARLEATRFAPSFGADGDGSPLESVASFLQQLTGVNFWISTAVREDLDEDETSITLTLPDRSVKKVLDIIAETSENLRWRVEDGVVKFVTKDELTGGQVLVTYSVQDLTHPIPDYPGRDINVTPSGGITPPDEDIEERESNVVTSTLLEDLIRNNVNPESWDADPANQIRITEMGQMVVNQTPDVQEKIVNLLNDLREATGIMVDVQSRFMKVEDNFLEDIGVDFRGLGEPGLGENGQNFNDFGDATAQSELGKEIGQGTDIGAFYNEDLDGDLKARIEELYDTQLGDDDVLEGSGGLSFQWTYLNDLQLELILRAVSKSERVELVTAPRILVHNTARANLSVLNQVAYVQDFDVEIAQAASIADPIVAVIQDGVILDVRPVVSADRRFITLEMRPTIAILTMPIEERVTTLGSQNSVTIQLPEVEIQRVRTTVPIPDGGTILLGGMKESEKQNLRSGVPILNKIPLLSALFERKGNYISNRKLLILLRANIVIPEEREPSNAEMGLTE